MRPAARLELGCFPWCWRSWCKSQQGPGWSGTVQAGCKGCPKPGGCYGAKAGLLRDAGLGRSSPRCSPRVPPQWLPSSKIDLLYFFHPFNFFFLPQTAEQAFYQRADDKLLARSPLWFLLCALQLYELPGASWQHTASSCAPSMRKGSGVSAGPQSAGEQLGSAGTRVLEGT